MSLESVEKYLNNFGLDKNILVFNSSSATVELAAKAVGCLPKQIAKTMSFNVNGNTILIVLAGDTKVDNSKYKATFGVKACMLPFEEVEKRTNHKVGGVCPFDIKNDVKTYLDESLKRFDVVYPAAGTDNSAVKLTIEELVRSSQNFVSWVDIGKFV